MRISGTCIGTMGFCTAKNSRSFTGEKTNQKNEKEQIKGLSNITYKPLYFGRTWAEHKSWGAVINPKTKEASFKIFTYKDTQKVCVTVEKSDKSENKEFELKNKGNGIFESSKIPAGIVENGDKYYYTIYRNGKSEKVKDPYSFKQDDFLNKSTIYDHSLYKWNDNRWFENSNEQNSNRISRIANSKNGLKNLNTAKIYEFNTATFTDEGTFDKAVEKLDKIRELGFNAIEIMPVENTYSFNWGYDGVDKMAVAEHLGGPDKLKNFIDTAHQKNLNVIMDMVPNHCGPDGSQLKATGPYFDGTNRFGSSFNYEPADNRDTVYVRDYIVNAALNWIDNYHCDGLRLDMTQDMKSDNTMKQIAAEINYHKPHAFLIAEDAREENNKITTPLKPEEYGDDNDENHCIQIDNISNNNCNLNSLGYDSEWAFKYLHSLEKVLYGDVNFSDFENNYLNAQRKVKYVMSHDEIGNHEGTRLIPKLMTAELELNNNIYLNDEDKFRANKIEEIDNNKNIFEATRDVNNQKAQLVGEKLAIMLQTGKLDKYKDEDNDVFEHQVLNKLDIKPESNITLEKVQKAYNTAFEKMKMGFALNYAMPGPKMIFQGDEKADLTPFRFFRQFASVEDEEYLYWQKGYKHGKPALKESKLDKIEYSDEGQKNINSFENLIKDLNKLSEENTAMSNGYIIPENTEHHWGRKVMGFHTKDEKTGSELFTIVNTNGFVYPEGNGGKYGIKFPKGEWKEILNTNDKKYGGNGNFINTGIIFGDNCNNKGIKMDTHSTLIFKRTDSVKNKDEIQEN